MFNILKMNYITNFYFIDLTQTVFYNIILKRSKCIEILRTIYVTEQLFLQTRKLLTINHIFYFENNICLYIHTILCDNQTKGGKKILFVI